MDGSTGLLLACLFFVLFLLIVLLLSHTHFLSLFQRNTRWNRSGWKELDEESEHAGILAHQRSDNRCSTQRSSLKEERRVSDYNQLEKLSDIIRYGSESANESREDKQYLVPSEEIHCTLEVTTPGSEQPTVHGTPNRERPDSSLTEPFPPDMLASSTMRRAISTDSMDSSTSCYDPSPDAPSLNLLLSYDERSQMFSCQVQSLQDLVQDLGNVWMLFFLLPHAKPLWRTEVKSAPSTLIEYFSIFQQCVRKVDLSRISLMVQLFSSKGNYATIAGQAKVRLRDLGIKSNIQNCDLRLALLPAPVKGPVSMGEVQCLITLSNEKLSVVVFKLRGIESTYTEAFVRVYLVQANGQAIKKKTTSRHLIDGCAEFGECITYHIQRAKMMKSCLRLSLVCTSGGSRASSIGHVTIGPRTSGRELAHFTRAVNISTMPQMSTWHHIRPRTTH